MVTVDDIIYIPTSAYGDILAPEEMGYPGHMISHLYGAIPLMGVADYPAGIFARVIEVDGTGNNTFVAFSSFPVSTGFVEMGIIRNSHSILVVESAELRTAVIAGDVEGISTLTGMFMVVKNEEETKEEEVPTVEVKVEKPKTRKEHIEECLELVFPGNWYWQGDYVIIVHFPEFEIKNSRGSRHIIRDLLVRIPFTRELDQFSGVYSGRRMTLTEAEIAATYRHSHMHCGANNWDTFCLGSGSSMSRMVMDMIDRPFDPEMFYVFLIHLNDFVRWESVEGGPYIYMSEVGKRNTEQSTTQNRVDFPVPAITHVFHTIKLMLPHLNPNYFQRTVNPDGSVLYRLTPIGNVGSVIKKMIDDTWTGEKFTYNLDSGNYILGNSNSPSRNGEQARRFLSYEGVRAQGREFSPRIYDATQAAPERLVQLPSPRVYKKVIETINLLMNNDYNMDALLFLDQPAHSLVSVPDELPF